MDFDKLRNHRVLTYFNLQVSRHKKGRLYALVKILKRDYFDGKKETFPVLIFKDAVVARCISMREHVHYSQIRKQDFLDSFSEIQTREQLKREILRRYRRSVAHISNRHKIAIGVSITRLKIIGWIK